MNWMKVPCESIVRWLFSSCQFCSLPHDFDNQQGTTIWILAFNCRFIIYTNVNIISSKKKISFCLFLGHCHWYFNKTIYTFYKWGIWKNKWENKRFIWNIQQKIVKCSFSHIYLIIGSIYFYNQILTI